MWGLTLMVLLGAAGATEAHWIALPRARAPGEAGRTPWPVEEIVFEIRSSNFALGAYSAGFFITAGGDVRRFDYFDDKPRRCCVTRPARPTHAELLQTFGSRPETVARIPTAEVATQRAKIAGARAGAIVCAPACNDAGGLGTTAWIVDGQGVYTPVDLGGGGDMACKNLASDAQAILVWLRARSELARFYLDDAFCTLPDRICKEEPCPAGGRACTEPAYCASVRDCTWCRGRVCVTAADGTKHCTAAGDPRCGNTRCACQGAVCAGGPTACRDLPDGSIACHR